MIRKYKKSNLDNYATRVNNFDIIQGDKSIFYITFNGKPFTILDDKFDIIIKDAYHFGGGYFIVTKSLNYDDWDIEVIFLNQKLDIKGRFCVYDWQEPLILIKNSKDIIIIDTGLSKSVIDYSASENNFLYTLKDWYCFIKCTLINIFTLWLSMRGGWKGGIPPRPALARSWCNPVATWQACWAAADEGRRSVRENDTLNHDLINSLAAPLPAKWRHLPRKAAAKQRAIAWWDAKRKARAEKDATALQE